MDLTIQETLQVLATLAQTITEAEIDEAVMHNRVQMKDAARVRQALRHRQVEGLER